MASRVDEVVEAVALSVPAVVATLLACRWWALRRARAPVQPAAAANDDVRIAASPASAEPQWPASFEVAETCRRINRNMAESAYRAGRARATIVDIASRRHMEELVRTLRDADDAAAWDVLEPITITGEVITLIESVRSQNGEFSAQSLRLCIERLWGQRVARDTRARDEAPQGRHRDPGAGGAPPA